MLITYLNNYSNNYSRAHQEGATKWKDTVEKWKQWCSDDFPVSDNLSPILAKHSEAILLAKKRAAERDELLRLYANLRSAQSLRRISIRDFKQERKLYQDRPCPLSFEFSLTDVEKYIRTLPYDLQRGEWLRYAYVKTFKDNLIKDLNFSQYKGNISLKQRTSRGEKIRSYRAQVVDANDKYITLKIGHLKKRIKWSSFPVEQLIIFASSYVKNNIGGQSARRNIFSSREATEKAILKEYRLLAVFCDWYGKYDKALQFAKKVESIKSDKGTITKLLLW